ncbi:MAG: hypothetical protein QOF51_1864 [Chloroflexota bacterium]|nr:hypothetical protein [Chloroflexota bacterium]
MDMAHDPTPIQSYACCEYSALIHTDMQLKIGWPNVSVELAISQDFLPSQAQNGTRATFALRNAALLATCPSTVVRAAADDRSPMRLKAAFNGRRDRPPSGG